MQHAIVSHEDWIAARKQLLAREKEFTQLRDQLTQARRDLPWERVDKTYMFEGPNGQETLPQLFAGRGQLVIYHFMFGPDWKEGCKSCSFWADQIERNVVHLQARDVTLIMCSQAPYAQLEAFKKRMGWTMKWVSSYGSDFNFDYGVSFKPEELKGPVTYNYGPMKTETGEWPGIGVFAKDERGAVYHTYSAYRRGIDMVNAAYQFLDLTPKGRDEPGPSNSYKMTWLRHRDRYGS